MGRFQALGAVIWRLPSKSDEAISVVEISISESVNVETTDRPLEFTPRFSFPDMVIVAGYASAEERERQLASTFGSMQWLWSEEEHFRFDQSSRELCSFTFFMPSASAPSNVCGRVPEATQRLVGGLRANAVREFGLPQAALFCCGPAADELMCVRDMDVFDKPLDVRLGVASGLDLLVQEGALVGWSLADPARYLTDGFAAPVATPPSFATRVRLAECLALVSQPLVDEVMDQDPEAWRMLRATERSLREQRGDRHRANLLHRVVSGLIEDFEP